MAKKHSAAGSYQGYTLQDVRFAFHLLDAPADARVSLEYYDDVTVHFSNGSDLWEQAKSALDGNPLADAASDLWKTLAIWGESRVGAAAETPERRFQLFVAPQKKPGPIAKALHAASSDDTADEVIKAAKRLLEKGCGEITTKHLERFLQLDQDLQRYVIRRAEVISPEISEYALLESKIGTALPPPMRVSACNYIIGWAQARARKLISGHAPAIVGAREAQEELQDFFRRCDMGRLLPSALEPGDEEVAQALEASPTFIRQLDLIKVREHARWGAVADYLQAAATRTEWAAVGLVTKGSFDRWNKQLLRTHQDIGHGVHATLGSQTPEKRGLALYSQCSLRPERLDAQEVRQEFVRGSYHDLSNREEIGWHEDYSNLLRVKK